MGQLTVRNVSAELVPPRKQRAARCRSAAPEHCGILREAFREGANDFEARAKGLPGRLRSTVDSGEPIWADRHCYGADMTSDVVNANPPRRLERGYSVGDSEKAWQKVDR
jgi:plasmid stability protein